MFYFLPQNILLNTLLDKTGNKGLVLKITFARGGIGYAKRNYVSGSFFKR